MTYRIVLERLKFLTNLLHLLNALLENENMISQHKLKIRVIKDRKSNQDLTKGESAINLIFLNEVIEGLILTKEVTDDNDNLILLSEVCFQVNLLLHRT